MRNCIIAARHGFPLIELAPVAADLGRTVEEMIAGLPNNNPEITSAHFPECRTAPAAQGQATLFLAKPLNDREHIPVPDVLGRLDAAGFAPVDLPQFALLKDYADELWSAGVCCAGALGPNSIYRKEDGGYAVYLITNPEDRGFHLHWLECDWGGETWFLVRRKEG